MRGNLEMIAQRYFSWQKLPEKLSFWQIKKSCRFEIQRGSNITWSKFEICCQLLVDHFNKCKHKMCFWSLSKTFLSEFCLFNSFLWHNRTVRHCLYSQAKMFDSNDWSFGQDLEQWKSLKEINEKWTIQEYRTFRTASTALLTRTHGNY